MTAIRRRLLDFELGLDAACCDEAVEHDWGRAFLSPSLPLLWDASFLAIEEPGMSLGDVVALADRVLGGAGFAHRTVVPCREADGRRLLGEAAALPGWEAERTEYMVWRGDSGRGADVAVAERRLAEIEPLRRRLIVEFMPGDAPRDEAERTATVDQLLELDRRYAEVAGDRWFAAPPGAAGSACQLLAGGGIGQVEDVATVPAARGRGLAQAVVLAALAASRAAGHELTFLTADADDWPRLLYAKLGFVKVGEVHVLRRLPPRRPVSAPA